MGPHFATSDFDVFAELVWRTCNDFKTFAADLSFNFWIIEYANYMEVPLAHQRERSQFVRPVHRLMQVLHLYMAHAKYRFQLAH